MDLVTRKKNQSIKSLIELGTKGYYPLLHPEWIEEVCQLGSIQLNKEETIKAKEIMRKVVKHKTIDRKRTVLLALPHNERMLFVRAFLSMVEGKLFNDQMEFH